MLHINEYHCNFLSSPLLSGVEYFKMSLICLLMYINPLFASEVFGPFSSFSFLVFKVMTDDDLIALVLDEVLQPQVVWKVGDVQVWIDSTFMFLRLG